MRKKEKKKKNASNREHRKKKKRITLFQPNRCVIHQRGWWWWCLSTKKVGVHDLVFVSSLLGMGFGFALALGVRFHFGDFVTRVVALVVKNDGVFLGVSAFDFGRHRFEVVNKELVSYKTNTTSRVLSSCVLVVVGVEVCVRLQEGWFEKRWFGKQRNPIFCFLFFRFRGDFVRIYSVLGLWIFCVLIRGQIQSQRMGLS